MLCQFQVYSKVNQLYIYIYPLFFRFFSHRGHQSSMCYTVCPQQLSILYILGPLHFHVNFRTSFVSFSKKSCQVFDWNSVTLQINLGRIDIFTILSFLDIKSLLKVYLFFKNIYLFGCTGSQLRHAGSFSCVMRTVSCSMWDQFLDQGWNPGPLHWENGVLATGPPGKSQKFISKCIQACSFS